MLIPTGGFGWVAGEDRVAPVGANECVFSVYAPDEGLCKPATKPLLTLAGPASTSHRNSTGVPSQLRSQTLTGICG